MYVNVCTQVGNPSILFKVSANTPKPPKVLRRLNDYVMTCHVKACPLRKETAKAKQTAGCKFENNVKSLTITTYTIENGVLLKVVPFPQNYDPVYLIS